MFGEAFDASGFSIGKGPAGEIVMGMLAAAGRRRCFLPDGELTGEPIAAPDSARRRAHGQDQGKRA